ncbi:MAG TPA: GGDEF domain-containing protein [Spirochaetota bacterium]|nr:GGDEF domain-containing protein [Spirochaetota bacterium]HOM38026.1 GGDEF domain-containing protein [Spirochaetota bacterium]HPQ48830.1 GGDEF domain-containing protein [Spirochaetota bacterium]
MDDVAKHFGDFSAFFDQYERKIMKLRNLLEIVKIINSTLEEAKLVQTILYSCQGQFLIQNATIFVLEDADNFIFRDKLSIGLEKEYFGITISKNSYIFKIFNSDSNRLRAAVFFNSIKNSIEDPIELANIEQLNPEIISPLWGKNGLYGFLILGKKLDGEKFNNDEITYIYQFAELSAISIENAKLFEMAIMDRMTKLYNHQYFKNRLIEEIERCKRYNSKLSLMMFDIDHFKSFNDTYGHQQGDIVLKETAKIIKESVRGSDIPARYGGEEFGVILPETSIDDAFIVAEKIRKRIEKHPYPGQDKPLFVTISCGVAEFPKDKKDFTLTDFVEIADIALYYSKRSGRNRATLYSDDINKKLDKMREEKEEGH